MTSHIPVPVVIMIAAEPVPPPAQAPEVVMATGRPEVAVATTEKLALYAAATGAGVVTLMV
jgi:hypothetical protein